jgi:hypothetical protein
VTNLEALEALLRRVSRTSRAWRKRHYLYEALEYFEKYGDRHSQIWVLLLWWVCDPDVEGYGLPAPPRRPMCTDCADGNGTCHRDGTSCDPRGVAEPGERERFERWCDLEYGSNAYLHKSATCGEWAAWQAARGVPVAVKTCDQPQGD